MSTREEKNREIQEKIEKDELKEKRKKITIIFFKAIFIIVVLFSSFLLYTKYISTNGIIIKEKRIVNNRLPKSFHGVKIIHFSDLHYGSTIYLEDIKNIVKKINARKPDLILFTGDLVDKQYKMEADESEKLIAEINKLSATLGKYAVLGDNDQDHIHTILKQSSFTVLDNSSELIYNKDNTPILLTGISPNWKTENQNVEKAFSYFQEENCNKEIYHILIMHEADIIDHIIKTYSVDLALAGNSLNGQICISKDLCLIKKEGSENYFKEYYSLGQTKLFVSSGIGTPDPYFRFMARPSIHFFRLATK